MIAFTIALACAVPVFAANIGFKSNNNGDVAGTTVVVDAPTGLAEGDVMIASVAFRGLATTTVTSPGWQQIAARTSESGTPDTTLVTFWNRADATEATAANFTFTLSAGARAFAGIARYDDVVDTGGTPVVASVTNPTSDQNNQGSSATATGIATTQPGAYVTAVYANGEGGSFSTPTGMQPLYNEGRATGTTGRLAAFDVSQAPAAAASKVSTITGGNQAWVAQTIVLKPEPTKLAFSTPARTGVVNGCLGPITVETQNTAGVATQPLTSTVVDVTTNGAGDFYENAACDDPLDTADRTIGTGSTSTADIYYKPTARGTGSHTITAADAALVLTQAQQVETVKLSQTITFNQPPSPQVYGDTFDIGSATSDSGLTVTVTPSGGCTLNGTIATVTSATTDCTLTATQAGDDTYAAATPVPQTVVTDPRPIEVTADPGQFKVYDNGGSDPDLTYSITDGDLVGLDQLSGDLARAAGETVALSPYAINQGTLSAGTNYAITFVPDTFAITPRPLSINAQPKQKTYGAASDPPLTYTLSNLAPGDNANDADIDGDASCSRTVGETVAGSPYTITCTQGTLTANTNYSFVTGTTANFNINPAPIDVDANPASKTYGDADPAFGGTLTGFVNGENASTAGVTGAADCTRPGAGTDEDVATYTGAITCDPNTLAAANYSFGTGNPADFTINKRTAHVVVTVADKVYNRDTNADVLTAILTNRRTGEGETEVNFDGTPAAAFATNSAGVNKPVDITGITGISGTKAANYDFVIDAVTADINPKPVDGSFTAADNKVYNGITLTTVTSRTVDAADVISPDVVTIVGGSANFDTPNVGNNKPVSLTGATTGGANGGNYTVGTIAPDLANITPRDVTGSFTAADKDFDGTTAATITSRSLNNEVPGDAVSLRGGTATFNNPDPGNDKTVTGTGFSLGGSDAGNYNLTGVGNTTADIQRRPAGNIPPPKDVKKDAENALGGDVKELPFDLNGLGYAFAPADQTGTLKVGKRAIKLFAIGGCDAPCTVAAKKTLVLIGTADGASAAAKKRKIQLGTQNLSLAAGEFGVIKLKKLTKKQRKAIRKAQKSKLVVKTTLKSAGETVVFKKKYRLKLK